jgi:hypothetical protein
VSGIITASSNLNVTGTLGVTGNTTLSNLTVTGTTSFNNFSIGGTLGVSGATTLSSTLGVTGVSTLSNTVVNGPLSIEGHILTSGSAPAIAASGNLGSGHSVSLTGSDQAGTISVTTGTGSSTGALVTVTFATAFGAAPYFVKLEPTNLAAASLLQLYQTISNSNFIVNTANELADSTTYTWGYMVVGAAS